MTPRPVSVNILGRFCFRPFKFSTLVNKMGFICLPSYPQTADLPGFGAPMWIVPHLKPPTIHARGRFPGRSPFKTGEYPRQRPFSRTVTFQNRGPSTPEVFFPEGRPFQPGTVHAGTCFPRRSPLPTGDRPCWGPFSRMVTFQNRGPSTLEGVSPDRQRVERGETVQDDPGVLLKT